MINRINSVDALAALRQKAIADINLRTGQKDMRLTVHMGTCGIAAGARDILATLIAELAQTDASVSVQQAGCAGLCDQEPMISLMDKAGKLYRYGRLTKTKVRQIIREHVLGGNVVRECLIK